MSESKIFFISILININLIISGQSTTSITGTVTAFRTYPLSNCIITSRKAGDQVLSDSVGLFRIKCMSSDELLFTANGFAKRKVKTKDENILSVNLEYLYSAKSFGEVVNSKHMSTIALEEALRKYPVKVKNDYSKYQNIYDLIRNEINTLKVEGTRIYNRKNSAYTLYPDVLLVVDGVILSDISFVSPAEVDNVDFLEDVEATAYGARGVNGVLKITMKRK